MTTSGARLGLVLGGGGARAAFQVGVLHAIARRFPGLRLPILTGVSAGAINTAFLANHPGSLDRATGDLAELWKGLDPHRIFEVGVLEMLDEAARIALQFTLGRSIGSVRGQGIVDTAPLRATLQRALCFRGDCLAGVRANLDDGRLSAVALTATSYTTGQTVTFFEGGTIRGWERPNRKAVRTRLTVDHVMASSALPVFFPPVPVDGAFYGDGGIRLVAPFAPAIHLGAERLLAVSTRYARSREEADRPVIAGPPSPAQLLGVLYSAIFLDNVDQDALTLERVNRLVRDLPPERCGGLRAVDLLVIRPSRDLGILANEFEPKLPRGFRFLTRRLGTRRARSQDFLSAVLFQGDYLRELHDLGVRDAEARMEEIEAFFAG